MSSHHEAAGKHALGFAEFGNGMLEPVLPEDAPPDDHGHEDAPANRCKRQDDQRAGVEAPDREIATQGDAHKPAVSLYVEGGQKRIAICTGTLHVNSGYAKRHFTLKTWPIYPCIELYPDQHLAIPFWSVAEWRAARGL
jgi:hypothetical protein